MRWRRLSVLRGGREDICVETRRGRLDTLFCPLSFSVGRNLWLLFLYSHPQNDSGHVHTRLPK